MLRGQSVAGGGRMHTISVAMATYNGETFLERQLMSVFAQSLTPQEIIICDDGSTDRTWEILERLKVFSPAPIHIYRNKERLGFRRNFLKIASLCQSDLIAFCDQDDLWDDCKLETVERAFTDEVMMVFHGAHFIDAADNPLGEMSRVSPTAMKFKSMELDAFAKVLGFSMVFRRALCQFDDQHGHSVDDTHVSEVAAHDQWYTFLASVLGDVVYLPDPLVRYRLHSANAMGFRRKHSFGDLIAAFRYSGTNLKKRIAVLRARCKILDKISADRPEVAPALAAYRCLAETSEARLTLYEDQSPLTRVQRYVDLHINGIYHSKTLPLSRWDQRKDLLVSVLGPGLLQKDALLKPSQA